jgi:Branched-chain polyamine synthase A C-terminal domain
MKYQLTRHFTVALDSPVGWMNSGKCLFSNALLGTRMVGGEETWKTLRSYGEPRELGDSALERRAVAAHILWPQDEEVETTSLLEQFESVANKIFHYRKVEAPPSIPEKLDKLDEISAPIGAFEPPCHYMWEDPKKLFRVMLDHFKAYYQVELRAKQVGPMLFDFAKSSLGRPERNGEFAQQLCTLSTSVERAEHIWRQYPQGAKIITLGDDDLMSLALTQRDGYEVDVFEIDRALVRFIKKHRNSAVNIYSRDLSSGLPEEFKGLYDVVLADPPYNTEGMEWFIDCCADALKPDQKSRLYLSTYPMLLEDSDHLFSQITGHGLDVVVTHPHFNRYPFPAETHKITKDGLIELGYHPGLVNVLMEVPYLYANLYECRRKH